MVGARILWSVLLMLPLTCAVLTNLRNVPKGIPAVDAHKLVGRWYRYANYVPCGWSGAGDFSDGVSTLSIDKLDPKHLVIVNTWRSAGVCGERIEKVSKESIECNKVSSINQLGGMGSGTRVRVAIDYDSYDINWGCGKLSIDNPAQCSDPMLASFVRYRYYRIDSDGNFLEVFVRHLRPSPFTIVQINKELQNLFGINVNQLALQQHSLQGCHK